MTQATAPSAKVRDNAAIRAELQAELVKHQLPDEPVSTGEEPRPGSTNHPADCADFATAQFNNQALRATLGATGQEVLQAMKKLDQGTYGLCNKCGKEIEAERLEVRVYSTTCCSCAGAKKQN